jgi:quinol monooxygenase YgiN
MTATDGPSMENPMVLERAEIVIKDGMMDEFLQILVERAIPLTQTFTGIVSFTALRGEEDPNNVMFLAEWQSIEAHLASRPEPAHARFREIVLPYVAGAKTTVHFNPIKSVRPARADVASERTTP